MVLRNDRINSRFEELMADQRGERPSTMESHSSRASEGDVVERRWLKRVFMAVFSGVELEGMRRTSRPGDVSGVWMDLEGKKGFGV